MGLRGPIGSARDLLHKTPVVSCPARIGETSSQVAAPASPVTKGTVGFSALLGGPGNMTTRVDPLVQRKEVHDQPHLRERSCFVLRSVPLRLSMIGQDFQRLKFLSWPTRAICCSGVNLEAFIKLRSFDS